MDFGLFNNDTMFVNASVVNENYDLVNAPIVFDIENNNYYSVR
jgi:hypothetical protein